MDNLPSSRGAAAGGFLPVASVAFHASSAPLPLLAPTQHAAKIIPATNQFFPFMGFFSLCALTGLRCPRAIALLLRASLDIGRSVAATRPMRKSQISPTPGPYHIVTIYPARARGAS